MAWDVDAYLRLHLHDVRPSGKERVASCPQCGKVGKFYASTKEPYGFLCFAGCFAGRGALDLIQAVEGVSHAEAWRRIVKFGKGSRTGTPEDLAAELRTMREPAPATPPVNVPLPSNYEPVFDGKRWRWPAYLTERGVTKAAAQHFRMGLCHRGRYGGRVVIPIRCPNGESFTARDTTGERELRYLNPTKEDGADHGRLVLGWPPDLEEWKGAEVFIVEGPLDAVRMWQHGFPALSLLGKELHMDQMEMLASLDASGFIVMLDPEESEARVKASMRLSAITDNLVIARLPMGIDPGVSTKEQVREAYMTAEPFKGRRTVDLDVALELGGRRKKRPIRGVDRESALDLALEEAGARTFRR